MRQLLNELNTQLNKAEKERLADPWFLRDLRDIVSKYDNPWRKTLFSDDFSTRGPEPAAPWKVTAGEFLIDWRHGLRTVVENEPVQKQNKKPQKQQPEKARDPAKELLNVLLEQALGGGKSNNPESDREETQQQQSTTPGFSAITAPVKITNTFSLKMDLSSRPIAGAETDRFEFGPYQGARANAGYRLAYNPNAKPYLELLRVSSRGTSTLESYDKTLKLSDGKPHALTWTRNSKGAMRVSLDGKTLMTVTDRSFKDPFIGFVMINTGGDYAIRQIQIDGN